MVQAVKPSISHFFYYDSSFLSSKEADSLLEHSQALQWQQNHIQMWGKTIQVPRLEAIYGDAGCSYQYRNITLEPLSWTQELLQLRRRVEEESWYSFAICIGNFYRHGSHHIGYHSDDSPEMGDNPAIASISLGATRKFSIRHKQTKETACLELDHGSLLLMLPGCQTECVHKLHKTAKDCGERINWTFRPHVNAVKEVV